MIVNIETDKGKHIATYQLPHHLRGKYKRYLIEQFQVYTEHIEPDKRLLQFAGGEWYIPKKDVDRFYQLLVRAYGEINDR